MSPTTPSTSLLTFNTETHAHNNLNQMTRLTITGTAPLDISYNFPAGQNNGKISSQTDNLSGETVTYQYDSLNPLITASSSQSWGETYGFDAFGNLLSKTGTGGAPTLSQSVYPTSNQIVGQTYDANGNQLAGPLGGVNYDAENRIASVSSAGVQYAYDSRNKRVWRSILSGGSLAQQVYVYGVDGQKIGTYTFTLGLYGGSNAPEMTNSTVLLATFFGHKRVGVFDRLGSAKYNQSNNMAQSFYPYGEDRGTAEPNDALKFATYTRDAATGLDYADQRYYANNFGRFMSPDPYRATATSPSSPSSPESWNRYAYVELDPINAIDPLGQDMWFISNPPAPVHSTVDDGGGGAVGTPTCSHTLSKGTLDPCANVTPGGGGFGTLYVSKRYHAQGPCVDNAKQVMNAVENNFSTFGNFKTTGPGGIGESVTFNPAPGPLTVGESIPITIQFGAIYTLNTSVTVSSVGPGSLVFTTVPGHLLYPASITFSASNVGNGSIGFDINVSGTTSSFLNTLAFVAGGGSFEDDQWRNFLSQIGVLCNSVLSGN